MKSTAFIHKHIEWAITVGLIVLAIIFYWLSGVFSNPNFNTDILSSLFVNLCAGSITAIIIIWGVEYLRKKENQRRFAEINKVAQADIGFQANMLVSYMANPLGFEIFNYQTEKGAFTPEFIKNTNHIIVADILKSDLGDILTNFAVADWKHLAMNLALIKNALIENIRVYGNVIPPEVLGGTLAVRRAFNSLSDFSFAIMIDLFVRNENEWPVNKRGVEWNRELRTNQIVVIARDLREYFVQVQRFIKLLDNMKFY